MSGSLVALVLGLVLLGLAVWLLRRANSSSLSSDAIRNQTRPIPASSSSEHVQGLEGEPTAGESEEENTQALPDDADESADLRATDAAEPGYAHAGQSDSNGSSSGEDQDEYHSGEDFAGDAVGATGEGETDEFSESVPGDGDSEGPDESESLARAAESRAAEQHHEESEPRVGDQRSENRKNPAAEQRPENSELPEADGQDGSAAPAATADPAETSAPATGYAPEREQGSGLRIGRGFTSVRKRRRTWAQTHGFEYLREDKRLAASWPAFLLGGGEESKRVASDVVSGFSEGHNTHIADVDGQTLMAMRRDAYSLVEVQFTEGEAMPEGMRRCEPLDQPPYVAYTTDVRALDRMLDLRVEDALASLAKVASDVVWSGDWVLLRISRKLDTSVWDEILPHVRVLVDAAMVLPPEHVNIPLEMDHADQTRAMPGGALSIDVHANLAAAGVYGADVGDSDAGDSTAGDGGRGFAEGFDTASSRKGSGEGAERGHLRAMPDPVAAADEAAAGGGEGVGAGGDAGVGAGEGTTLGAVAGESAGAGEAGGTEQGGGAADQREEASVYSETVGPDDTAHLDEGRPEVTRPAEPVVFPTRSENQNHVGRSSHDGQSYPSGAEAESADFFKGAGIFEDDDDDGSDHIYRRLPRLGEDPGHTSQSSGGYSRVIRTEDDHEATIFYDYEDDVEDGDSEDFTNSAHVLRAAAEPVVSDDVRGDASGVVDFGKHEGALAAEDIAADDAADISELTNVARLRRDRRRARRAAGGGGRHRAPDARHARPEPIEAVEVEIETVDAEIVEDED